MARKSRPTVDLRIETVHPQNGSRPTPDSALLVCQACGAGEWHIPTDLTITHSRCRSRMRPATPSELQAARKALEARLVVRDQLGNVWKLDQEDDRGGLLRTFGMSAPNGRSRTVWVPGRELARLRDGVTVTVESGPPDGHRAAMDFRPV